MLSSLAARPEPRGDPVSEPRDVAFTLPTQTLGVLHFRRVTPEDAAKIDRTDLQHRLPPDAFLSLLMVTLGAKESGGAIAVEETFQLSTEERSKFADGFLDEHKDYYRERIFEEIKNADGETAAISFLGEATIPRENGESSISYLTRMYRDPRRRLVLTPTPTAERPKTVEKSSFFGSEAQAAPAAEGANAIPEGVTLAEDQTKPNEASVPPDLTAAEKPAPDAAEPVVAASTESSPATPTSTPTPTLESTVPAADSSVGGNKDLVSVTPPVDTSAHTAPSLVLEPTVAPDAAAQMLRSVSANAERMARTSRRAMTIAILALLAAIAVPLAPVVYNGVKHNHWSFTDPADAERQAELVANQRQQINALKSVMDEMRSLQPKPAKAVEISD